MRLLTVPNTRSRRLLALAAGCMLLAGCSVLNINTERLRGFLFSEPQLRKVSVTAAKDVNGGYPVAVDLVVATDRKIFDTLANLRATEWFAGKADYLRQHQKKLELLSWEVVPGQTFAEVGVPVPDEAAVGVLVFADYPGDRSYRATVAGQKKVTIRLGRDEFEIEPK